MRPLVLAIFGLGFAACYFDARPHAARSRGAAMLECPTDQVAVRSLGSARFEVQGCGSSAIVACDNIPAGGNAGVHSVSCHREDPPMDIPSHPAAVASLATYEAEEAEEKPTASKPVDKAAVKSVLSSIDYSACGVHGRAKIALTFDASGAVSEVVALEGALGPKVIACLKARFGAAKVPAAALGATVPEGGKQWFGWPIGDDAPASIGTSPPSIGEPAPKPDPGPKPVAM